MYKLMVSGGFAAAHQLRGYTGKCESLHGHNWRVQIYLVAEQLNDLGLVVDFTHMKKCLHQVLQDLDHTNLNNLPFFQDQNPSSENIARYVFEKATKQGLPLASVRVWESDHAYAEYFRE